MGTVQKLNRKVVDRDKLDTPNTPIHDRYVPGLMQALQ